MVFDAREAVILLLRRDLRGTMLSVLLAARNTRFDDRKIRTF